MPSLDELRTHSGQFLNIPVQLPDVQWDLGSMHAAWPAQVRAVQHLLASLAEDSRW